MDLGITLHAIIGYPNRTKLNPQAFNVHMPIANISFRTQPIRTHNQHKPYVYLEISLIPSLQEKIQNHATTNKTHETM